ncbi:MAG: hypothetical protein O6952_01440, partial [Planctomycetota bacterium]|nr:hypothetical protein [Planctomycetota bacterium]
EMTLVTTSVVGPQITYDVTITNKGGSAATNFFFDLYLDRPVTPLPGDFLSTAFLQVSNLDPGVSMTFSVSINASVGTFRSWVQVDTGERVAESNEGNNHSFPISVTVI